MRPVLKSAKLANVCYDIAARCSPAPSRWRRRAAHHQTQHRQSGTVRFHAPEEMVQDVIRNLPDASGYCDSKGLFAARKAVMHYTQQKKIRGVQIEDIYIGNGVSELIVMTCRRCSTTAPRC